MLPLEEQWVDTWLPTIQNLLPMEKSSFFCWHPSPGSFRESQELLLKEPFQTWRQEVPWRLCELHFVDRCRVLVCYRLRVKLIPPYYIDCWEWSCPDAVVWHVAWRSFWERLSELGALRRKHANQSRLCKSRGNWSGVPRGAALI